MKIKIDFKSMVFGVIIAAVLFLSLGTIPYQATHHGRFQLILTNSYAFVFDRENGQVWQKTVSQYVGQGTDNAKDFYAPKR